MLTAAKMRFCKSSPMLVVSYRVLMPVSDRIRRLPGPSTHAAVERQSNNLKVRQMNVQ